MRLFTFMYLSRSNCNSPYISIDFLQFDKCLAFAIMRKVIQVDNKW